MLQSRFDRLSERLLTAGIVPRHVRRYCRELGDHFDDLVREEKAGGATPELAETRALARLGSDDALADAMLSRPELRSFMARYPWAVFGLGPIALLALSVMGGLYLEFWLLNHSGGIFRLWTGQGPGPVNAKLATEVYTVYNTLIVYGGPLLFAWALYWLGSRQRIPMAWTITGVAIVCVLGGFQDIIFYDTGCRGCGHLIVHSDLVPPFQHFAQHLTRAALNLAIAGGVWWFKVKRRTSHALALSRAA